MQGSNGAGLIRKLEVEFNRSATDSHPVIISEKPEGKNRTRLISQTILYTVSRMCYRLFVKEPTNPYGFSTDIIHEQLQQLPYLVLIVSGISNRSQFPPVPGASVPFFKSAQKFNKDDTAWRRQQLITFLPTPHSHSAHEDPNIHTNQKLHKWLISR